MTPETTSVANGQAQPEPGKRPRRAAGKRAPLRSVKEPARKKASRRASPRRSPAVRDSDGYSATASKLFSRGTRAVSGAYEWAADGASRALPVAFRNLPDQRSMMRMVDDRPYILGAIGLGIGAVIGMMLPARMMGGGADEAPRPRGGRRAQRKR